MHPKALLDAATELVRRVLLLDHPADAVVSRFFREQRALGPRERNTLAETAYAVLRRKPYYELLARSGSGARERRMAMLAFHAPRDFLMSVLNEAERAWIDACDRIGDNELKPQHRHNLPEWLVERLRAQVGGDFDALAEALLRTAPLDLRVNTMLQKREHVIEDLRRLDLDVAPTPYSPWGLRVQGKPAINRLPAFTSGAIEVQDEGSQLLALLLDARRGEMVTDFCAGAGGKTLAVGATMRNTGRLYALDVSAHRLDALKPRLARSGLSNVHPIAIAHERDERVKRLSGKMDRVLVDAPCSGLGTLRRNPDLKWRLTPDRVSALTMQQAAILTSAARLVKPGGRLIYATCSLLREENEDVAQTFAQAQPAFRPLPAGELLTALGVPDAPTLVNAEGQLRLWPHRHDMDGFFAAVWQRE